MVTRRMVLMASCVAIVAMAAQGLAQRGPAWEQLGKKEIEGKVDHDKIKCHGKDTYRALQFRVNGAAVKFLRIQVEYGNHQTRAYPFQIVVPPGGSSPALDLVGGERDITNVEFWYEKASWGKKPEVRLYGRR